MFVVIPGTRDNDVATASTWQLSRCVHLCTACLFISSQAHAHARAQSPCVTRFPLIMIIRQRSRRRRRSSSRTKRKKFFVFFSFLNHLEAFVVYINIDSGIKRKASDALNSFFFACVYFPYLYVFMKGYFSPLMFLHRKIFS